MTEAAEKLKSQLASLAVEERELLAYFLLNTLPVDEPEDVEWEVELNRRVRQLETGEVQGIPADQVFRELRE